MGSGRRGGEGQSVYFNAWGGSQNMNDYIRWVGERVEKEYGIALHHVRLDDTAHAVRTAMAESAAGRDEDGSVDLMWIDGGNFGSMKERRLLSDGFATEFPNWAYVDTSDPSVAMDFNVPVEGQESPWGRAKLVFFTDTARTGEVENVPKSADDLRAWAKAHPGRFTCASGFHRVEFLEAGAV